MIEYEKQTVQIVSPKIKVCDNCKKKVEKSDWIEFQEFYHIDFKGGYGSIFGDSAKIKCDLCQSCLKEIIGEICRIEKHEDCD